MLPVSSGIVSSYWSAAGVNCLRSSASNAFCFCGKFTEIFLRCDKSFGAAAMSTKSRFPLLAYFSWDQKEIEAAPNLFPHLPRLQQQKQRELHKELLLSWREILVHLIMKRMRRLKKVYRNRHLSPRARS